MVQLDQWHEQGKNVTTPLLDVVVAACSRMGDANRAFETFEAYERLGVKQRSDSYNALMEVCAQNRQVCSGVIFMIFVHSCYLILLFRFAMKVSTT